MSAGCDGFRFVPDAADGEAMRTLITAANRVLRSEVGAARAAARRRRRRGLHARCARRDTLAGRAGRPAGGRRDDARAAGRGTGRRLSRRRGARARPPAAAGFCQRRDRAPAGAAVRGAGIAAVRTGARHRLSARRLRSALSRPRTSRRRCQIARPGKPPGAGAARACGSAPRQSMSSRCSAPIRSASARCFGRCGTAERRRSCRADAVAARRSRSIRTSRSRSMPRSGGGSLRGWRCGRTGWNDWRRRRAAARGLGLLPPMRSWPHWAASLPTRCAGVLLALGYRAVIEGDREFFVGQAAPTRHPTGESADAPPPPAATIRSPNSRS